MPEIDPIFEQNKAILEEVTAGGKKPEALKDYLFPVLSTPGGVDRVRRADETLKTLTPPNDKSRAEVLGIDTNTSGWLDRLREAEGKIGSQDKDLAKLFEEDETQKKTKKNLETAEQARDDFSTELTNLRNQIDSYKIGDAQLNEQISGITARWDARIAEMRDVNERREKAMETLGFRTGARFSGGIKSGVFGGVIAEEERQGVLRIGQLEAQKSSDIAGARSAQREQNWKVYVEKVNQAQDVYKQQLDQIEKLNKLYIERQKELDKERKAAEKVMRAATLDNAIVGLINQGITDPKQILDYLNFTDRGEMIGDVTLEEVSKAIKLINDAQNSAFSGLSTDVRDFKTFFPDVKLDTEEGMQAYLRWKALLKPPEQWSDPYNLGGDIVQKNLATGEIRTAVNVPKGPGPGTKTFAVNLYGSTVDDALKEGATPQEAVLAAVTLANNTGTKLNLEDQNALLEYAIRQKTSNFDPLALKALQATGEERSLGYIPPSKEFPYGFFPGTKIARK